MDELEKVLDELDVVFEAGQRYFKGDDRLRIRFFETGVKPTLNKVLESARTLLDSQYSLSCGEA